jgi:hypothetical protein
MSDSLHQKLSLYALAAGAAGVELLAMSRPAVCEVVYTPAHQVIRPNQLFAIDLNHDGITDFTIQNIRRYSSDYRGARLQVAVGVSGAVVSSNHSFVKPLPKGALIGPNRGFRGGSQLMALEQRLYGQGTYAFGSWFQASDGYVGFKFKIDGEIHYGWARVSTRSKAPFYIVAEVSGYAYETEADKPIVAGVTTASSGAKDGAVSRNGQLLKREASRSATLGALAAGDSGLAVWRREPSIAASI